MLHSFSMWNYIVERDSVQLSRFLFIVITSIVPIGGNGGLLIDMRPEAKKWATDLLFGRRKQNCADDAYLRNNGPWWLLFGIVLTILGKGYKGKPGRYRK